MWRVRNFEQLKETPTAIFFTGTVSPERYDYIKEKYKLKTLIVTGKQIGRAHV